jgi:hypothetical protein
MLTQCNLFFNNEILGYLQKYLIGVNEELIISTATFKDMRLPLVKEWYGLLKESGKIRASGITSSKNGKRYIPLLNILTGLRRKGIRIMTLSSSKSPSVKKRMEGESNDNWVKVCPRNHQKFVLVDGQRGFLTSANLTGCGMGLHHCDCRNFESAIMLTSSQVHVLREEFLNIWSGNNCNSCRYSGKKRDCIKSR